MALCAALVALPISTAEVAAANTGAKPTTRPTAAQIKAAVRRAEHSRGLWATVNICNTKAHPDTLGIRGQMPALGFPASLGMIVRLKYLSAKHRFEPIPGAQLKLSLGRPSTGYHQGGATFKFTPPVTLSGSITFQWRSGHKLLGQTTRSTGRGYKEVDQGDPPGHSSATCTMK
jgi:hypothetical protein